LEPDHAIIVATTDAQALPLTIIDGNYRAVAHFLRFADVPA
jgi:hypothetical protein